jgi:hypothetical protein
MWEKLSDADLLAQSDVIVRGEHVGLTRLEMAGAPALTLAGVRVRERYKGPELTLALVVQPPKEGPVSSTDIRHPQGADGLWFLRARTGGPSGLFAADHPQRFVSEKQEPKRFAELLAMVQKLPSPR